MKLLFAPDSFKGSIPSARAIELLTAAARKIFPDCQIVSLPMADGGEGTVDALAGALHGHYESCTVTGPLGDPVQAQYAMAPGNIAIIEMASASGLPLVPPERRNPLMTTTYGTGQLIQDALQKGARKILLSIGGSATNDGGMGVFAALGARFLDTDGNLLEPIGENLKHVSDIDLSGLMPEIKEADITILCDVNNPLTGPNGSAYVYGPQKGASPEIAEELDTGMKHYAKILKNMTGTDYSCMAGAGAAGGFPVPFLAFTRAKIAPGIETVFSILNFEEALDGVDLVVTGEGRVDEQSAYGKVLSGVGRYCKKEQIPAVAITGCMGQGAEAVYSCGIDSVFPIVNAPMPLEQAMTQGETLFADAAERMFRLIRIGMTMRRE